ncbi:glycoside hydrolase family 15 protein [Sphingobacterium corticis]|uniref:Glycoside hydrolase family 15 protein n=1 Tax=Sphingobacterium corticis TaxID=1812823 RepID=A0ABW5NMN2_9SPHI
MDYYPTIESLALISDRNTCAILDKNATINWYSPKRFDDSSVFHSLLDSKSGGSWEIITSASLESRNFIDRSSVLEQNFVGGDDQFTLRDWMPIHKSYRGIVRQFSSSKHNIHSQIKMTPDYGRGQADITRINDQTVLFENTGLYLFVSVPIQISGEMVGFSIPAGTGGWAYLTDLQTPDVWEDDFFESMLTITLENWSDIASEFEYEGLYQTEVLNAVRGIQQLTCGATGGVIAAATTSLPEVIGAERNYDYRYVWVRDAALITGALSALEVSGKVEEKFLEFMYESMRKNTGQCVYPLYTIDNNIIEDLTELELDGYQRSRPVQIGNIASDQRQLDAEANILISSKIIYDKYGRKTHWEMVRRVANYICENWHKPENGIWEEGAELQYTSGKVFSVIGLEMISRYSDDEQEKSYWQATAKKIRKYVGHNCMTSYGAFANYAGSEEVDVSSALYVLWNYTLADSPEMLATIDRLEQHHSRDNLYWRTLVEFDASKEGAFLAGSCWIAHYYAVAGNYEKSAQILDSVKSYQNDLGYFAEEADVDNKCQLGNFNQTFVQSSFICAANGLSREKEGVDTVVR